MCSHAVSAVSIYHDHNHACRRPEHRFGFKACRKHTMRPRWTSGTDYPLQAGVLSRNWSERAPACFGALLRAISYLGRSVVVCLAYIALMWNWPTSKCMPLSSELALKWNKLETYYIRKCIFGKIFLGYPCVLLSKTPISTLICATIVHLGIALYPGSMVPYSPLRSS